MDRMSKKRAVVWIMIAGLLVAAVVAGSIRFASHLRDAALQQARAEQAENLRFIKVELGGQIVALKSRLEACQRGETKVELQPLAKTTGFRPMYRPGIADADGGGN